MPLRSIFSPRVLGVVKAVGILAGLAALASWLGHERAGALLGWPLIAGLVLSWLSMVAYALRFRAVMAAAGFTVDFVQSLRLLTLSVFVHFFVPMSIGSEMTKFLRLRALSPSRGNLALAAALLLDHAVGFITLLVVSLSLLAWRDPFGFGRAWPLGIAVALPLLGALAARIARGTAQFGDTLQALRARLGQHKVALARGAAWSLAMHALLASAVFVGARDTGIAIAWPDLLLVLTGAGMLQLAPVNVAGVGAGDVAGTGLYLALGLALPDALTLVSLLYCYRLAMAAVGGLWELAGGNALR